MTYWFLIFSLPLFYFETTTYICCFTTNLA